MKKNNISNFTNLTIYTVFLALFSFNVSAWDGYDSENDTRIEITTKGYIEEGDDISFYDWKLDEHHDAQVRLIESFGGDTRVEIYDLTDQKERFFDMD